MNLLRCLLWAAFLAFPLLSPLSASGAADDEYEMDTVPESRIYADPLTGLLYHYDADSRTLTPTGETWAGSVGEYITVDVYARGEYPSPETAALPQPCAYDYCVAALVALVGSRTLLTEITSRGDDLACFPFLLRSYTGPMLGVVTFRRALWGIDTCTPGFACGNIYVDEIFTASDCTRY